jgi:aspartyl-tRNA(Asn)/glutamyl-tRNA(Gln) amidotransferase subunit A
MDTICERAAELLRRIAAVDSSLRCYVAIDEAAVLREAARLDALPAGEHGPLHGWALAVKDIIDVAGLPTRAGSSFFRRDPERDAPVVAALRAAGALVIGKTNTHEFAWGITTENPHFGRSANPWDPARTVGGSSGGSGAAVAAGLADIALGSDTLGSIRLPAALNGISGLRPATGALSLDDIFPLALGLDTVGPFARDLERVQRTYEVLSGRAVRAARVQRVCWLRGGGWDRIDRAVSAALDAAVAVLREGGIIVDEIAWWDDGLMGAVAVVQQRAAAQVHRPYFAEHEAGYGADVRARVAYALGVGETEERAAREVLAFARATWDAATGGYDAALAAAAGSEAPLAPVPATFRDETLPLMAPASGFGLPVAAVPIGFGPAGMPLGMQIIARDVAAAFALGRRYQSVTAWHEQTPALASASR